jgi:hypothetical protein
MPTAAVEMGEEGVWCFFWSSVLSIKRLGENADLAAR